MAAWPQDGSDLNAAYGSGMPLVRGLAKGRDA